jgi:hypothetical protein
MTFAALGTVTGGVALKYIEVRWSRRAAEPLNYDNRWSDPKYVSMIHHTRETEARLGFDLSACECRIHQPKPVEPAKPIVRKPVLQYDGHTIGGYAIKHIQYQPHTDLYDVYYDQGYGRTGRLKLTPEALEHAVKPSSVPRMFSAGIIDARTITTNPKVAVQLSGGSDWNVDTYRGWSDTLQEIKAPRIRTVKYKK